MRWCDLGGSWAVSAAGTARIIHAGCKDRGLHNDAPVRRTAQEEPAAVGADAQLSETQSHPVRGSPSQSTSLHHRSQDFVARSRKVFLKRQESQFFPSKRQFLGEKRKLLPKKRKLLPSHAIRGTGQLRWGSQYGAWWCFTATTRMDPKFGMHLICIGPSWTERPDPKSNRGLCPKKWG